MANHGSIVVIEGASGDVATPERIGGKAAGLAVMANELLLPVPPAFAVTTAVCNEYLANGWRDEWTAEIREALEAISHRLGRRFGEPARPLLVSVRSGAAVSMPGMMDTLLNVGMTPAIRDRLAEESGNPAFAADTWLRFNRMFAEIVLGGPDGEIAENAMHDSTPAGMLAAADRIRSIARELGGIPSDPFDQLLAAIRAVFDSWQCDRAQAFRKREQIPASLGTAATVQAMVFGNLDERSGTGVVFTRDPATGVNAPYGDYLPGGQGEDVVSGSHRVAGLDALQTKLPGVYDKLLLCLRELEHHYRDMCDVEFTVSEGKLYILQTRIGRRSPLAAVRIAVDMANDPAFPLTRDEAVARIDDRTLQELAHLGKVRDGTVAIGRGLAASPGVGCGQLCFDPDRAADLAAGGTRVVLAREETSPADVHGMMAASALITTLGGLASHAAVVARSWAIPAVCSLEEAEFEAGGLRVGTSLLAEGDVVTVDGTSGCLYAGDQREDAEGDTPELLTLRDWAGTAVPTRPGTAGERSTTLFEVARTIQLKGICSTDLAAACLRCPASEVETLAGENEAFFRSTPRGFILLPAGREWLLGELRNEIGRIDGLQMEQVYHAFLPLNQRFKQLVSDWQVQRDNGGDWKALVASMDSLHRDFSPLVHRAAGCVPRLQPYTVRFGAALTSMREGDTTMLAAPIKDSYHTVWFEFHEELITLTGRDRATEEANPASERPGRW